VQFPITIGLHRSRFLDSALLVVALLCVATTLAYPQPLAVRLMVLAIIGMAGYWAWRRLAPQMSGLRLEESGQISLLPCGGGDFIETALLEGATVHPRLIVARLKAIDDRRYTLIVTTDSMSRQEFRRLRIFLRWRAEFSEPADGA